MTLETEARLDDRSTHTGPSRNPAKAKTVRRIGSPRASPYVFSVQPKSLLACYLAAASFFEYFAAVPFQVGTVLVCQANWGLPSQFSSSRFTQLS